jgi:threonine/homoserine/homoserine lactone efflux protein
MSGAALLAWTLVALLGVVTPGADTMLVQCLQNSNILR